MLPSNWASSTLDEYRHALDTFGRDELSQVDRDVAAS
jgi:hypothetical protein